MIRFRLRGSFVVAAALLVSSGTARADKGVIKGKVVFKGDAANYGRKTINTTKDPNCRKSKKKIGTYKVILNKKSSPITVRNVLVYVKKGLGDRKFDAPKEPVVLTQFGCEYKPHVFGIMAGQTLTVKNGDPTNHNIHFLPKKNQEFNFTQPKKGMTKDLTLIPEETFKVKCDVHPWMSCYMQVFDHPFFAVTGKDGTFTLNGLPPGKYVVEAWHETFGTKTLTVEVAVDETKEADFTYQPE
ncbi:MAG: carboxypeptidase regulatory-like domain-containing protein [Phycisphaerae bacterium]